MVNFTSHKMCTGINQYSNSNIQCVGKDTLAMLSYIISYTSEPNGAFILFARNPWQLLTSTGT